MAMLVELLDIKGASAVVVAEKVEDGMYVVTDPRFVHRDSQPDPGPPVWVTAMFGTLAAPVLLLVTLVWLKSDRK